MGASYLDEDRLRRSIVAIATATGRGAIGIVRLSGADAIEIGARVFSNPDKLRSSDSHRLIYGRVLSHDGSTIDSVLAAIMRAPGTYTGEDVVEFHTHGGTSRMQSVLRVCLEAGAEAALPGEFTFRAFLNGKVDLTQAEAVADLISAGASVASRVAMDQLDGVLHNKIENIRRDLIGLRAVIESSIDFPEEDLAESDPTDVLRRINGVVAVVDGLVDSFSFGRMLSSGARVVISGPPNVGKSSLFNSILHEDRAIVTEVPGTTRDAITEVVDIGGIPVILTDTAGIRESDESVEREGVRRAEGLAQAADLVIEVVDAASGSPLRSDAAPGERTLVILNKCDLLSPNELSALATSPGGSLLVSARTGMGVDELCDRIASVLGRSWLGTSEVVVTRRRHYEALRRCREALEGAREACISAAGYEIIAAELRSATGGLDDITGRVYDEEIINRIFSDFCIGK